MLTLNMAEVVVPIFGIVFAAGLFFVLAAVGLTFFHQSRNLRGASAARFHILENLEDGIILLDVKGRILDINRKARHYVGLWGEGIFGKPIEELIEDWPNLKQIGHMQEKFRFDHNIRNAQQSHILEFIVESTKDRDGNDVGGLVVLRDISERKEIESTLQLQSFALKAAANAIVITNVRGSIEWVNPAFTQLTGYTPEEVLGANPRILKSSRTTSEQYADLWKTILDGKVWHGELVNRRKDESEYIEEMTIAPMLGDEGHITHFIAVKQDITQRRQAEEALIKAHQRLKIQFAEINALKEKLREQAIRDSLTGLFNRRYLQETLKRELSRARRDQVPVSIVMMDIDYFKQVNDSYGHAAGDSMLQDLGEMLRALTREGDVACRYGGEEFIAVMPGAPLSVGVERAELIRREFEFLKVKVADFKLHPTLSLGVAAFPEHASTVDELLAAADRALYLSKQNGRNQVQIYKD
jgi:diguanylate cyclase (GGDEF)-like protein/PAS domain S-box-containing protein